ncbi:MAG: TonB-dependent receptor, partial [Betaproteobacteria bacterium]|nr:TonB-dependent receptor [Betaproteobacteria bacterium]
MKTIYRLLMTPLLLQGIAQADDSSTATLPRLVVTATRTTQDGFTLPAAIDRIDADTITEGKAQVNLSEVLNRVPGIVVQNRQNYAQDLQISSRGFGARASFGVRGIRLIADGIPATTPDGQGQAASFSLTSADRIEVLRGPFSALYGNAAGGVIHIFTADGPATPTLKGNFLFGSYQSRKAGLQAGGQQGDVNYLIDLSRFDSTGYRAHSAVVRDQLNARLKLALGEGHLMLIANALDQPNTQDPLGLTRAQVQADPRQADSTATTFNTRKSTRQNQLGAIYDWGEAGTGVGAWQARLYGGSRQVVQFLGMEGNTPLSSGGVVDLSRHYSGLGLRWTRRTTLLEQPLTLSLGLEADTSQEARKGFVNRGGEIGAVIGGERGALKRDEDNDIDNRDVYLQAEWQATSRWQLFAGVRHSRVAFDSRDHFIAGLNPDDSGQIRFRRTTPVAGAVFQAAPTLNLYANWGQGFETPTFAELAYRPGGATGLNLALQPATSRHWEIGLKARQGGLLVDSPRFFSSDIKAALFRVDTDNEIVTNSAIGGRNDFRNATQTRREGLELSLESRLLWGLEASLAYTWLHARFTTPYAAGTPRITVPAGNLLPGVPRAVLYAELAWRNSGRHVALEYRASSRITVNDANSDAAPGYGVVNLHAGVDRPIISLPGWRWG